MPRANKTLRKLSERLLADTADEPKARRLEGSLLCEYVYRSYYISLTVEEANAGATVHGWRKVNP